MGIAILRTKEVPKTGGAWQRDAGTLTPKLYNIPIEILIKIKKLQLRTQKAGFKIKMSGNQEIDREN